MDFHVHSCSKEKLMHNMRTKGLVDAIKGFLLGSESGTEKTYPNGMLPQVTSHHDASERIT
jgi:hypothetical protein